MDLAICAADGQTYNALQFAALGSDRIQALRYGLSCTECGGPGFYRKGSSSGQGPCFGARPHAVDCSLSTTTEDPWGEAGDDVVQRMEADRTRIILSFGATQGGGGSDVTGLVSQGRGGRSFVGGDAPIRSEMRRNPDKLLKLLVNSERFRTSPLVIAPGVGPDVAVSEFFVNFSAVNVDTHLGLYRGFWGKPHSVREWKGLIYVNTGRARSTLSFWLPVETINALVLRYKLGSIQQLSQMYVLIIGTPELSTTRKFNMNVINPRAVGAVQIPQA